MRTIIVGGVAGGMSAATRLRRLREDAEIIVLERGEHVSFANCGLPYYAGGVIEEREDLLLQTPETLKDRFNLDVRVHNEAIEIKPEQNIIVVRDIEKDSVYELVYDNLILSMGASAFVPPIKGKEKILTLRNVHDVDVMKSKIEQAQKKRNKAVVIGAGFIGIEMVENLRHSGLDVSLIELSPQVLPPLDPDMAFYVHQELIRNGVDIFLGSSAIDITDTKVVLNTGNEIDADLVVGSIGVRPEVSLAQNASIVVGERGGVVVDNNLRTNIDNIFAVGDMVEKRDIFSDNPVLIALANTANKQGRRVADVIAGRDVSERTLDAYGTAVVQVFDATVAMTGVSRRILDSSNRNYFSVHLHPNNHAGYYPGAETMHLTVHVDADSGHILGAQGVGPTEVARRIDVLSTAIFSGITAPELIDLELAYSPQHGSAKDAINMVGYIADGIMTGVSPQISAYDLDSYMKDNNALVVDVRTSEEFSEGHIGSSVNIPIDELRDRIGEIDKVPIVVVCQAGQRGHSATRILQHYGFDAKNLSGGYTTWEALSL